MVGIFVVHIDEVTFVLSEDWRGHIEQARSRCLVVMVATGVIRVLELLDGMTVALDNKTAFLSS